MENISKPMIVSKNKDNTYDDSISWGVLPQSSATMIDAKNYMRSIYLKAMGINADIGLRDQKIDDEFRIINCSENYTTILSNGLSRDRQWEYRTDFLHEIGDWAQTVCKEGRVIFDIVNIFSEESRQFIGFMLRYLDNSFCTTNKNYVVFEAPFVDDNKLTKIKKVKIPLSKCIVIDFPQEKGGYRGFQRKVSQVLTLGEQFERFNPQNPSAGLERTKKWEREFKRITSDWGNNHLDDCNDYYQLMSLFRFNYTALLCTIQAMNEFGRLIAYFNDKLGETAELVFTVDRYDATHFPQVQQKWANGNLSYMDALSFLFYGY